MPKTLFLVRHSEAEEPSGQLKDIDRALTPNGRRDATRLGNFLADEGITPELIITSNAQRAVSTAEIIAERVEYDLDKIKANEELYEPSVRILLRIVNEMSTGLDNALLVSHNPAITFLADYLTSEDLGSMSAGTMVTLTFDLSDWSEISQHTGSIKAVRHPD